MARSSAEASFNRRKCWRKGKRKRSSHRSPRAFYLMNVVFGWARVCGEGRKTNSKRLGGRLGLNRLTHDLSDQTLNWRISRAPPRPNVTCHVKVSYNIGHHWAGVSSGKWQKRDKNICLVQLKMIETIKRFKRSRWWKLLGCRYLDFWFGYNRCKRWFACFVAKKPSPDVNV